MNLNSKKVSLSLIIFIVICFLLPFATLSCQNQELSTVNGFQLVTGSDIEGEDDSIPANAVIIILLLATIGVVVYLFMTKSFNELIPGALGIAGIILLLIFKATFTKDIHNETDGMVDVEYKIGYWLTFFGYFGLLAANGYSYFVKQKGSTPEDPDDKDESKGEEDPNESEPIIVDSLESKEEPQTDLENNEEVLEEEVQEEIVEEEKEKVQEEA